MHGRAGPAQDPRAAERNSEVAPMRPADGKDSAGHSVGSDDWRGSVPVLGVRTQTMLVGNEIAEIYFLPAVFKRHPAGTGHRLIVIIV
jgi:hypothetical protein